jgi:arginase
MSPAAIDLIGAPTDVGASMRGAALGPEALRVAGLAEALRGLNLPVADLGNLTGPANPQQAPSNGYRHLPEVLAWNQAVHQAVAQSLAQGHLPMLLGGDHCLAVGSIGAVAQHCQASGRHLRVLWFDAHADFNTPALTPSGNLHGMPVAVLCGQGPQPLVDLASVSGRPALAAENLRLIAVRSVDPGERALVHASGIEVYDMRYLDEQGMRAVMQQALFGVDAATHHLHLSFDVDGLDPDIAPGVGTPVRGGPNYREAQLCMEMIADTGALGSVDIVELNPARDVQNRTAELVVDLMQSLFGKSTLMRPSQAS